MQQFERQFVDRNGVSAWLRLAHLCIGLAIVGGLAACGAVADKSLDGAAGAASASHPVSANDENADVKARHAEALQRIELGRSLLRSGDIDGAEKAFQQAHLIAPGNVDVRVGLAQILVARQQPEEALAAFAGVLEGSSPTNVRALNGSGVALDALGRHAEAQERYRRVLAIAPSDRAAQNNLRISLSLAGKAR